MQKALIVIATMSLALNLFSAFCDWTNFKDLNANKVNKFANVLSLPAKVQLTITPSASPSATPTATPSAKVKETVFPTAHPKVFTPSPTHAIVK